MNNFSYFSIKTCTLIKNLMMMMMMMMMMKNIFYDPSLEPSCRDGSNEGSQHMFSLINKKNYI